ncbi:hypothetical protein [Flavobacterium sp. JAS]|uniref:hypothetical protein n=1 Tax=Flavobacterium sp. JAS TaxID=2897329 RepID=UPI000D94510C|nr:hypothetical protein [Flavobacterium sp. JAS]MCD0468321.1 hypothetical protein [Flavobacterium sp. JAS]
MEEYRFEYIDQIKSIFLCISLPFIFYLVFSVMNSIDGNIFNVYIIILIPLSVSFLFYWLNRNRIKIQCIARIGDKNTEIESLGKLRIVCFEEISSYRIQANNSISSVLINLKGSEKIKLSTYSQFFHKSNTFNEYCFDLEDAIDSYKNKYNIEIKREKTLFEKKRFLPFLIIFSIICGLLFIINTKYENYNLWPFIFPVLWLWAGYLEQIKKKAM